MSYISDHPTNFNWTDRVRSRVRAIQYRWPWKTFINTYRDHPPGPWQDGYYDEVSFDVWGGGGYSAATYTGYRGKRLPRLLGRRIFNKIWNEFQHGIGPDIDWIIYRGRMWWNPKYGGNGWGPAPPGPVDSDAGHWKHIHVTFRR